VAICWTREGERPASAATARTGRPSAQAVNAPHLVALVRAGATFAKGKLIERPEESSGIEEPSIAASRS
jgi:hypothetical protein